MITINLIIQQNEIQLGTLSRRTSGAVARRADPLDAAEGAQRTTCAALPMGASALFA